jgi:hypothetical protein
MTTTKPKTPLIALQGGLVLSALRRNKKNMSDDPFAWYPFAAESTSMPDDTQERRTPAKTNEDDNESMSGDSVVDHDPQPRIVLPPGLTLDKKSRSSASVVSLGSWEPLDLMDLEPADSEESEEDEGSSSVSEDPSSSSAGKAAAKTLAPDDASPSAGSRRVTVSYFASHVSVVVVMLSLTFLGTKRSSVHETSLISIRGAVKPATATSRAIMATEPTEDMNAKAKVRLMCRVNSLTACRSTDSHRVVCF